MQIITLVYELGLAGSGEVLCQDHEETGHPNIREIFFKYMKTNIYFNDKYDMILCNCVHFVTITNG